MADGVDNTTAYVTLRVPIDSPLARLEIRFRRRATRKRIWATCSWNPREWRRRYVLLTALDREITRRMERALLFGEGRPRAEWDEELEEYVPAGEGRDADGGR